MTAKNFGNRLRLLRSVLNVTQAELARRVDITAQHVSRIELGLTSPSFPLIDKICAALDIEPSALFLFPDKKVQQKTDPSASLPRLDPLLARYGRLFTWTGLWLIDPEKKLDVWSKSIYALLGHAKTTGKATLRRFLRYVHPDDREEFKTSFGRAVHGEVPCELFFRFIRKGGVQRQGLFRVDPLKNREGDPRRIIAFVSDVTEWHVLERSLVQSKTQLEQHIADRNRELSDALEKYKRTLQRSEEMAHEMRFHERIVATSCDGHAYADTKLIYQNMNESYEDLVGLPREQIIGRHLADIVGRELFQAVVRSRVTQALQGVSASYEQWRQCPVKGKRFLQVAYTPCMEKKRIVGIAITVRDLTELKVMERRLQQCEKRCQCLEGASEKGGRNCSDPRSLAAASAYDHMNHANMESKEEVA